MICVDANALVLLLNPNAMPHLDQGHDRVRFAINRWVGLNESILIPAPAIAELVAGGEDRVPTILAELQRSRYFEIVPLDMVTAIETGRLIRERRSQIPPDQRLPGWKTVMKYDAQIAATAIIRGANSILTDDTGIAGYLEGTGVNVISIQTLPYPPEDPQQKLF